MFNFFSRKDPNNLELGQEGLDLIKSFEGWEAHSYDDGVGYQTIGYGHKLTRREKQTGVIETEGGSINWRNGLTKEQGEQILAEDAKNAEHGVSNQVRVKLKQCEYDALVSWTFNLGSGALSSSTMLERLNNSDYESVPSEMKRWVFAGGNKLAGLVRRRKAEALLFEGDDWRHV
jgi:lysozyme